MRVDDDVAQGRGEIDRLVDELRPILIARYGVESGSELAADVAEYGCSHAVELAAMTNPRGYLYRVAQSRHRRYRRWGREVRLPAELSQPDVDAVEAVSLDAALARLSADARTIVVLVHTYGYTYDEVSSLTGLSHGSVRNRLHRAMSQLRRWMEAD